MHAYAQVRWFDASGAALQTDDINAFTGVSTATLTRTGFTTAPALASYGIMRLVSGSASDGQVRFFSPSLRKQVEAVEIRDGAITASHVRAGEIDTNHLAVGAVKAGNIDAEAITVAKLAPGAVNGTKIAGGAITETKIGPGSITTGKIFVGAVETDRIKVGAVGRTFSGNSFASTALTSADTILLSWTMPTAVPEGSALQIVFSLGYDTNNGPNTVFKVKRNGTTLFENATNNNGSDTDRTMAYSTVITVGAGDVVAITGSKGSGAAIMHFIRASLLVVMR